MKKLAFGILALLVGIVISSCSKSAEGSKNSMESLADDISENGNDWDDPDKWESAMRDYAQTIIDFANSDPSKEECKSFAKAVKKFEKAAKKIKNEKALKALNKAQKAISKDKDLKKELKSAMKKLDKLDKKYKLSEDEDDEDSGYEYDDGDDDEDDDY